VCGLQMDHRAEKLACLTKSSIPSSLQFYHGLILSTFASHATKHSGARSVPHSPSRKPPAARHSCGAETTPPRSSTTNSHASARYHALDTVIPTDYASQCEIVAQAYRRRHAQFPRLHGRRSTLLAGKYSTSSRVSVSSANMGHQQRSYASDYVGLAILIAGYILVRYPHFLKGRRLDIDEQGTDPIPRRTLPPHVFTR
jgi:hypothetical protein